jgi:hypothetical protein
MDFSQPAVCVISVSSPINQLLQVILHTYKHKKQLKYYAASEAKYSAITRLI